MLKVLGCKNKKRLKDSTTQDGNVALRSQEEISELSDAHEIVEEQDEQEASEHVRT